MTREARFPDDPATPFWWGYIACKWCGEREIALSPPLGVGAFVCMVCGNKLSVGDLLEAEESSP